MTHDELIDRAIRWLRRHGCHYVVGGGDAFTPGEIPDAIGWHREGSILIECKTSRDDFYADRRKPWRLGRGLGLQRYYLAPPGVIPLDGVPALWGLLECHPKQIRRKRPARRVPIGWWAVDKELRMLAKRAARLARTPEP